MLVLMTSFTFMSAGVCARLQITVVLKLQNAQKKKKRQGNVSVGTLRKHSRKMARMSAVKCG